MEKKILYYIVSFVAILFGVILNFIIIKDAAVFCFCATFASCFFKMLCPNTALALEFKIWIGGQVHFSGYAAEQGVGFEEGLIYTSNARELR